MKNVGIVIVSYHNETLTKKYVTRQLTKLTTSYTLVVVNNASTKEKSRKLAKECNLIFIDDNWEQVQQGQGYLLWTKENLGYAKGNNLGVRFLNKIGDYTHFLFSNDDIEIYQPDTLEKLMSKMSSDNRIGVIGPKIVGIDGRDQSPHDIYISPYRLIGWKLFPFLRHRKKRQVGNAPMHLPSKFTYWVQGSFMLVDAIVFNKIGMFDEHTFLYYEEAILAEKIALMGKRMYFDSDVKVLHYEGGSTQRSKKKIEMESRIYYMSKYKHINKVILFLLKHLL